MKTKSYRTKIKNKSIRVSKQSSACQSIGKIEKDMELFIFTYGQFSLIDAISAVLKQTGPAHLGMSTWTAAFAHLEKSAQLMESLDLLSFRMIVDRSFETRQPKYYNRMIELFGHESIRAIRTHAKFFIIHNDKWNLAIRTSMNLNENPRLENIEISESKGFVDFFKKIIDDVFVEVEQGESLSDLPKLKNVQETLRFKPVSANVIKFKDLNEPKYTHEIIDNQTCQRTSL